MLEQQCLELQKGWFTRRQLLQWESHNETPVPPNGHKFNSVIDSSNTNVQMDEKYILKKQIKKINLKNY